MANLPESITYDAGVYQLELTDPVQGGPAGVSNAPLKNLANRTAWLKSQIDGIKDGAVGLALYARLSSPTFTGSPSAPTAALGDNTTKLATTAFVQATLGGFLSKSIAGTGSVTLTAVEAGNGIIELTGALTGNRDVIVPSSPTRPWIIRNATTGAFSVTVKTAVGTGVLIPQGKSLEVYCDGTNVVDLLAPQPATARTISLSGDASGGASFDGSNDVIIAVTVADNSHSHSTSTLTGLGSAAALNAQTSATDATADRLLKVGASPMVLMVDPLRHAVESASGGRMTVLYTAKKQPCYMHVLPRFLLEDVAPGGGLGSGTHPAFLVNGVAKSELFIGAYLASMGDGEALALPGKMPQVSYTFDQARAACVANGAGWHLMTNWEWAAVALWCMANGFQPRGNTDWGRHHTSRFETGRRVDGVAPGSAIGNSATLTGSGPAAWSHDGTPAGIADLVGNVWEWNDGMRLQDGRVYMPNDNNYTLAEASWPAQNLWFSGSSTTANGTVNLITTSAVTRNGAVGDDNNGGPSDYRNPWSSTPITGTAPLATKQALIAPAGISPLGAVYARTYGARFPLRGAVGSDAGNAGLAALNLYYSRGVVYVLVGFRPAFAL